MSTAMALPGSAKAAEGALLGDPELRRFLRDYVKKRVNLDDVDDVVQTILVDALSAEKKPDDPIELRKWLVGVARHKCADVHRRAGRERPPEDELPEMPVAPPPVEERALVRWAEEQALSTREASKTLGWMAREGEGDKLEHIAEEEALPAARVRQRVSRMRRLLKERWLAELALVAALGAISLVLWRWLGRRDDDPIVADPSPPPSAQPAVPDQVDPRVEPRVAEGQALRRSTLELCRQDDHQRCIEGLDRAGELDPAGDTTEDVGAARRRATDGLRARDTDGNDALPEKGPAPVAPKSQQRKSEPLPPSPKAPSPKPPSKGSFEDDFAGKQRKK